MIDQPPEHAHSGSEQANEQALRDQLDEAICDADFDDLIAIAKRAIERGEAAEAELAKQSADADRLDQLLIDERAITARLGRELAALRALHQQIGDQP